MTCCNECGVQLQGKRREATFCGNACRAAFNNRRAVRGAELYDLFMAMRYDREAAKVLQVWGHMCRLANMYRDEDIAERDGRPSWVAPKLVVARKVFLKWAGSMRIKIGHSS